jgi:hypothetical protein
VNIGFKNLEILIVTDSPIDHSSTELFDVISATRAMRRLKSDPVPDELIVKVLEAGT